MLQAQFITPASNFGEALPRFLFCAPQRTQRINGDAFQISSLQPNHQIDIGLFYRSLIARTLTPGTQVRT